MAKHIYRAEKFWAFSAWTTLEEDYIAFLYLGHLEHKTRTMAWSYQLNYAPKNSMNYFKIFSWQTNRAQLIESIFFQDIRCTFREIHKAHWHFWFKFLLYNVVKGGLSKPKIFCTNGFNIFRKFHIILLVGSSHGPGLVFQVAQVQKSYVVLF